MVEQAPPSLTQESPGVSGFSRHYAEHSWALTAWLTSRVPSADVDDVAQEVWTKVAAGKFPGGNFRAWLFQVARRLVIDRHRSWASKLQRSSLSLSAPNQDGDHDNLDVADWIPPPGAEEETEVNQLRQCLEKLDSLKQAVVRGWLDDLKYTALGTELELTEAEISNHFRTAKTQLRRCLERNQ